MMMSTLVEEGMCVPHQSKADISDMQLTGTGSSDESRLQRGPLHKLCKAAYISGSSCRPSIYGAGARDTEVCQMAAGAQSEGGAQLACPPLKVHCFCMVTFKSTRQC